MNEATTNQPEDHTTSSAFHAAPCSLFLGDCLEVMATLPDKSVDAIITDLPYGTTACKWDAVIPFAPMWEQVRRVLKPNGVFVTTASQPFTTTLIASNLDSFKYCWVWEKNTASGIASAKYRPMKYHEDVVVFAYGKTTYNPEMIKRTEGSAKRLRYELITGGKSDHLSLPQTRVMRNPNEKNPSSVLNINTEPNSLGKLHPTQKPLELMRYMVRTYTNPGDVVLDPCMGSGTTCLAAKLEGRGYIGIEREPKYFETAKTRIEGDADLFSANAKHELPPSEAN